MENNSESEVWVETTRIENKTGRQISQRAGVTELLNARKNDLNSAIGSISSSIGETLGNLVEPENWNLDTFEAQVGINLAMEAGVVIMKGSSNATIALTLTYTRKNPQGA